MILEAEEETRDFVTVYKKDFFQKPIERRKECRERPVYPPPLTILNGAYKRHLKTVQQNAILPQDERSEDPQETLNRMREKYPRLKTRLREVLPDQQLIERDENEVKWTVYHTQFSKGVYSPRVRIFGRDKRIPLPDDWVISETTQTKSFRNPWKIATKDLLLVGKAAKPPDNLVPCEEEREILRIRTGDTEYDATIEATGNRVIKECRYGPTLATDVKFYTKGPDSPRSECSRILAEPKLILPSSIF